MTNLKLKTEAKFLDGILSIEKVFPDKTRELIFEECNIITLTSKQVVLASIYASSLTADPITSLSVGTGGTIDPAGLYPKNPPTSVTSLYTYLLSVAASHTVDSSVPSVTFIADLDQGTANGSLITEAGLLKQSTNLFNIKCFPGVPKTSEFGLHFSWTIKIA